MCEIKGKYDKKLRCANTYVKYGKESWCANI